jgi:hypothetical protein
MVVTGGLTVGAVFVLRKTKPTAKRPYRTTGYPLLPALYVTASLVVVGVLLVEALSGEPGAWYRCWVSECSERHMASIAPYSPRMKVEKAIP